MAVQLKLEDFFYSIKLRTKTCPNFTHSCMICMTKKALGSIKVTQLFKLLPNSKAWMVEKVKMVGTLVQSLFILYINQNKHIQYSNVFSTFHSSSCFHAHKDKQIIPK